MKHQTTSTKIETNSKIKMTNSSAVALSDFGFDISNLDRLKGEL